MNEPQLCLDCGAEIPADAPAGQCPKCLLKAGFESQGPSHPEGEPTASSSGTSGFQPPTVEELAPRFAHLEILELLGKGGMGAVYKARQPGLDRLVAVKILPPEVGRDPDFAERFSREARAMARLSHPQIVAVHDFGQTDGLFYFVMEYIDGANLRQAMQAERLKPDEALAIVPQVCEALQYAHDEGVVHRDIKPENILLDKKGRVKIADFGLSKLLASEGRESPDVSLTGTHQLMGTVRYMAPEQMQGTKSVDHRADIYSVGVVFYELLTGEVPMGRFDPPSQKVEIDVRLDEVVLRALAQEPAKRYQQASSIKIDVESISSSRFSAVAQASAMPESASDADVFRRLTVMVAAIWFGWTVLFAVLHWGYVSGAKWYFRQELLYKYLNMGVTYMSYMLLFFLAYWWYLLAKEPASHRGFSDVWKTLQTPNRRVIRLWIPGAIYSGAYIVGMLTATALGSDEVQATTMLLFWVAAPPLLMMSCAWAYGVSASKSSNAQ